MGALVIASVCVSYLSPKIMGIMFRCITDRRRYPASEPASAYINKFLVAISMLP